jgi:hypothetical protein
VRLAAAQFETMPPEGGIFFAIIEASSPTST